MDKKGLAEKLVINERKVLRETGKCVKENWKQRKQHNQDVNENIMEEDWSEWSSENLDKLDKIAVMFVFTG